MIDIEGVIIILNDMPESEAADIRRCLTALYSVREGEQPLDREFGLASEFQDKNINIARNLLALEIIKKTKKYETRVQVEKVDYQATEEGRLIPVVCLKRGEK